MTSLLDIPLFSNILTWAALTSALVHREAFLPQAALRKFITPESHPQLHPGLVTQSSVCTGGCCPLHLGCGMTEKIETHSGGVVARGGN